MSVCNQLQFNCKSFERFLTKKLFTKLFMHKNQLVNYYYIFSTMKHQGKSQSKFFSNNKKKDRYVDASKQDDFIFNRTPILASALQKLKKSTGKNISQPKRPAQSKLIEETKIKKKIKTNQTISSGPLLSFTPLQQDLYNFYNINKTAIKSIEVIPQPKFEVGSTILTAITDRGIGGKYLVANLFRNKKAYIDYKDVSLSNNPQAIQSYQAPGNFVVATVVKGSNPKSVQLCLNKFLDVDQKILRVGECLPAEIKSKQQVGCHLQIYGLKNYKAYLSKHDVDQQAFENLQEKKQILCVIKQINHSAHLIKLGLSQEQIFFNLKGIQEQQMSRMELDQYVAPGTLVNTKILKIVQNGVIVKFLKIFIGYIHVDHLEKQLNSYVVDDKIAARIIYYCVSPPTLYLSQKHVSLASYSPMRPLYYPVQKPLNLAQRQHSYFNNQQQFFVHPTQLHTEIANIGKFWVKQNNYFERYQIMASKKLGLRVGEVAKVVPFTNFKIYGQGEGKFKVMCLDVWNKVVKLSYDPKIIKSENMLMDIDEIDQNIKYCGFINGVTKNGVIVEFCNNIRGIIGSGQLKMNQLNISDQNIGEGIQAYVSNIKKGLLGLSLLPPDMRNKKRKQDISKNKKNQINTSQQQTTMGIIKSINTKTVNPIYLFIKGSIVKISVFDGIKPASIDGIQFIKNIQQNYSIGQKVPVFRKGSQYYLYPPQQLVDKDLRICRIVSFGNHFARVQISNSKFLNCHITQITDLIVPYPFSQVKIGQLYLGKILPNGTISLRSSIIQNGIPKSMKEYKQKFQGSQYQADYRNRLLTIGSAGLNVEDVIFGYVKSFSGKGVFVSINSQYDVRVQISQLSDQYIQDKEKQFRPNKLLLMRLISEKVRPSEPNKKLFDASCRQSVVKHGYPLTQQALMIGLTVNGVVSGFAKGKALVRINSSRYTGIIGQKDIEGINLDLPFQKQLKIGTHLKCKIIQLKNDEGRQLIRLSTLKRVFEKYAGVQLQFQDDQRVFNLWNSFKEMDQVQPPKTEKQILISEQLQEQQDQYARLNRLLAQGDQQNIENQKGQEAMEIQNEENQQQANDDQEEQNDQQKDQQEEEQQDQQIEQVHQTYPKEQLSKLMSQFQKMPHPPSFYQSLVLANPTSQSYLMYISSLLPVSTPQQIRSQFIRAIASLSDIKDKDNLWISWLNTQIILGGFMTTVKKALQSDVGRDVYNRIVQILMQQEKWTIALEFSKKMLKKFNKDPKAYSLFIKSILKYSGQNNLPSRFSPAQVIKKAYQCLKNNEAVTIQIQYGKSLYQLNQNQKARNIFQNLITKYPKRTDIWNVYIDLEVKHGELDRGRNLLQRALSMDLKKKRTITILKKYHQIQQKYGTSATVESILKRAQAIAQQGIDQQESQQQIAD